jgi:hypothetical protein
MADGAAVFSGLREVEEYIVHATVAGQHVEDRFTTSSEDRRSGVWTAFSLTEQAAGAAIFGAQATVAEYDPASNTTFVSYLGPKRQLWVTALDHDDNRQIGPVYVADYPISVEDDHGIPSMCIDNDGYIHIVFGEHDAAGPQYCKSGAPRDITATWAVSTLSATFLGTYHMITCDRATGDLYMLRRAGPGHGTPFPKHEDGALSRLPAGGVWADIGQVVDTRLYSADTNEDFYATGLECVDGRVYMCWSIAHGAAHDGDRADVFCAYYDIASGNMMNAAGTSQGAVISSQAELFACRVATRTLAYFLRMEVAATDEIGLCWQTQTGDSKIGVEAAVWDGTSWTVADTGARSNYMFLSPGIRRGTDEWEVFAVVGREDETAILHPLDEDTYTGDAPNNYYYVHIGHDLGVFTSPTGAAWTSQGVVLRRGQVVGQGVGSIQVPRNSSRALKALVGPGTCSGLVEGVPLYGLSDEDLDPLFVAARQPRYLLEEQTNTWEVQAAIAPLGSAAWRTHDLTGLVPIETKMVLLRSTIVCNGTVGGGYYNIRQLGTTRKSFECSPAGALTGNQVFDSWVMLGPDKKVEIQGDSTRITSYKFSIRGFRV